MRDDELLRYSRQIMLPDLDIEGQEKLLAARVMLVGLGGLGSPAALYLAAAGVGTLVLVDDDEVDLSNLQRQIAHGEATVGENKATSAARTIHNINPHTECKIVQQRLDTANAQTLLQDVDVVLDCSDNFSTRFLLNDLCWAAGVPLVSGAAIRWEGQVTVFDANVADSPCYRCLYLSGDDNALNCAENGVAAPLVGIVGATQAMEALKILAQVGDSLVGRILVIDTKHMDWRTLGLGKRKNCPTCG